MSLRELESRAVVCRQAKLHRPSSREAVVNSVERPLDICTIVSHCSLASHIGGVGVRGAAVHMSSLPEAGGKIQSMRIVPYFPSVCAWVCVKRTDTQLSAHSWARGAPGVAEARRGAPVSVVFRRIGHLFFGKLLGSRWE